MTIARWHPSFHIQIHWMIPLKMCGKVPFIYQLCFPKFICAVSLSDNFVMFISTFHSFAHFSGFNWELCSNQTDENDWRLKKYFKSRISTFQEMITKEFDPKYQINFVHSELRKNFSWMADNMLLLSNETKMSFKIGNADPAMNETFRSQSLILMKKSKILLTQFVSIEDNFQMKLKKVIDK